MHKCPTEIFRENWLIDDGRPLFQVYLGFFLRLLEYKNEHPPAPFGCVDSSLKKAHVGLQADRGQ